METLGCDEATASQQLLSVNVSRYSTDVRVLSVTDGALDV